MAQSGALADQPGRDPLTIGGPNGITFTSRECPQEIDFPGGEQLVVDKKITGGSRVVQTFGDFWSNVTFSGTFWENADARVTLMTQLRQSGTEQLITWRAQRYYGFVLKFTPKWKNGFHCPFECELIITRQATSGTNQPVPQSTIDQTVSMATQNAATMLASVNAIDPKSLTVLPPSLLANINANVAAAGPLAPAVGTPAGNAILSSVATALQATTTYLGTINSLSPSYVAATMLSNSLTLIARNVQQGQSPNAVVQQGGSYLEIAVTALGSIDLGIPLADANNAAALYLSSFKQNTVVVPPLALPVAA